MPLFLAVKISFMCTKTKSNKKNTLISVFLLDFNLLVHLPSWTVASNEAYTVLGGDLFPMRVPPPGDQGHFRPAYMQHILKYLVMI